MSLRERYKYLLAGFEDFNFTDEQLRLATFSFENAKLDFESCMACQGDICKTTVNRMANVDGRTGEFTGWDYSKQRGGKFYYALLPKGCAMYKRPHFAVIECPGPAERKEEIASILRRVKNREERQEKARVYG